MDNARDSRAFFIPDRPPIGIPPGVARRRSSVAQQSEGSPHRAMSRIARRSPPRDAAPGLAATTTETRMLLKLRLCALIALSLATGAASADESHRGRDPAPPKVILDTDFNTISDDGQALAMLAQLDAAGKLDLLGVTVA